MDLRSLDDINARRELIQRELGVDLSHVSVNAEKIGDAQNKNCENMFGAVPLPVGLAGPLRVQFSSQKCSDVYIPLATTEGALVASVNRGCKAVTQSDGAHMSSDYVGITRSICFTADQSITAQIETSAEEWKRIGEMTSDHLKITGFSIDSENGYIFLTINADTDEAMGMNMVTVAAQAIGTHIANTFNVELVTVAGNVDSDKKPSLRTKKLGRGYSAHAEVRLTDDVITNVLKSSPERMLQVAHAKLETGSHIAGALGVNLHAANVVAAAYLATGQDAAHVVEGSLGDTRVTCDGDDLLISVHLPAILVGVRGGGTTLPAQRECLSLLLSANSGLHPCRQMAEILAAAVLSGEISLLAAQATQTLASSHTKLAR